MSFLTPLYLLGLAAVSLPVVFHLIRRMPRGRFSFSTLMFLRSSPPRLTRRSRLDNILLLVLRGLVLILLALAFTRPFWRQFAASDDNDQQDRKVAVLVDTSASMRRGDLWEQAAEEVDEVLDELKREDAVALFKFDRDLEALFEFDAPTQTDPEQRAARIRAALEATSPSWDVSDLGHALISVADELHQSGDAESRTVDVIRQVVLVTDLQEGSLVDTLYTYEWPEDVQLDVHVLKPEKPTNAGLHWAGDRSGRSEDDGEEEVRVRVTNDEGSQAEQFELQWVREDGSEPATRPVSVYIPPGESRIVNVPTMFVQSAADRLVLTGDDCSFDNTLYLVTPRQDEVHLVYIGSDEDQAVEGLRYYVEIAFAETERRKVNVVAYKPDEPLSDESLRHVPLVIVTEPISDEHVARLRQYREEGGTLLYVLQDPSSGESLGKLMGIEDIVVEEAEIEDYAMFGEIDFTHPLFAPFASARYNDFTKIRFWKHRRVELLESAEGLDVAVVARFDNGDPALLEQVQAKGKILVLSGGWQPSDSQWARSSKFAPLMHGILERAGVAAPVPPQYEIGDTISLAMGSAGPKAGSFQMPDGSERELTDDADTFDEVNEPGVYRLISSEEPGESIALAVNVPATESRTTSLGIEQLEQFGIRMGDREKDAKEAEIRRQMRDKELEGNQKLWRALIVAALGVLIVETWLAGSLARQAAAQPEVTG